MPHNFRITGQNARYVSKAGSDSNAGSDPNAPCASIAYASQQGGSLLVIGTGQYVDTIFFDPNANFAKPIYGDGKVIVSGNGTGLSPFCSIRVPIQNLEVTDYEFLMRGITASGGGQIRNSALNCIFRRGIVQIGSDNANNFGPLLSSCLLISAPCYIYNGGDLALGDVPSNNIFINSPVDFSLSAVPFSLLTSYLDENSPLKIPSADYLPTNCNIRGKLIIAGVEYANLAAAAVAYPALLTKGNINAEPQFNRAAAEDFTLKLSSPHLDKGIGPTYLRYALMYYIEFSGSVGDLCTTTNTRLKSTADGSYVNFLQIGGFTVNEQGGLVIAPNSSGNFEGYYTTDRIRVAATAQPIVNLPVVFAANFNSDYPTTEAAFSSVIPDVYNNNVPARNNFASGQAGRNPHRLTVQARFSPNLSPDVTQSGDWVAGVWMDYEIGVLPTYNAGTGVGNGSPLFDNSPGLATQMVARWVQLSYRARNNYYSR